MHCGGNIFGLVHNFLLVWNITFLWMDFYLGNIYTTKDEVASFDSRPNEGKSTVWTMGSTPIKSKGDVDQKWLSISSLEEYLFKILEFTDTYIYLYISIKELSGLDQEIDLQN